MNVRGLFKTKFLLVQETKWQYLINGWEDKKIHTFPVGINPKVNVIARLDFELAFYGAAFIHISHCAIETPQIER